MIPEQIRYTIQGGLDFPLPKMIKVLQKFSTAEITDVQAETRKTISSLKLSDLKGKRIAITAGSRKITNLQQILKTTVVCLKEQGALPFIVPAMGSHGQASPEGQLQLLADLGITEDTVNAPIISSMDVVKVGETSEGYPIYCDQVAFIADGIVVCGRIKPHTSIKGNVESGLCKMMVVGLGKHKGATCFHRQGYHRLADILPISAEVFLKNTKVLFGLGIIENAFDRTYKIEAMKPEILIKREEELLEEAKKNMPCFFLDEIDVLIVKRIGKDISGAGMDPNITGRAVTPLPMKATTPIKCIVVLDITAASHGNATGIGGADITTMNVVRKMDFNSMYTNVMTSGALVAARIPVVLNTDEEAVRVAIKCTPRENIKDVKVVRILDTLHMREIDVSESCLSAVYDHNKIDILGENPFQFDESGSLIHY